MRTLTYKDAGVDIDIGNQFVEKIKQDIAAAKQPWVLSEIGLFGGMIDLRMACEGFENPVLIQVVNSLSRDTVGYDNLSYNSLGCQIVCGCLEKLSSVKFKPISFLDYIGTFSLTPEIHARIINGMVDRFEDKLYRNVKIPIIGGETAEMPVIYRNYYCTTVVGVLTAVMEPKDAEKIDRRYKNIVFWRLNNEFEQYKKPVLIQSIDGVGTRSREALDFTNSAHALLNHCVNDIAVHGAEPLMAVTYADKNTYFRKNQKNNFVLGSVKSAQDSYRFYGHHLIASNHPGIFQRGQADLVCAMTGIIERDEIIDGSRIGPGDLLVALPSVGLHTNGISLARKAGVVREEILKPHLSYVKPIQELVEHKLLKGAAHITGGGIPGNLVRILPKNCRAIIKKDAWPILPVFKFIQEKGPVDEEEMFRVFNMGIGMILTVSQGSLESAKLILSQIRQPCFIIGEIVSGEKGVEII